MQLDLYKAADAAAHLIGTLEGMRNTARRRGLLGEALALNERIIDALTRHCWSHNCESWLLEAKRIHDDIKQDIEIARA